MHLTPSAILCGFSVQGAIPYRRHLYRLFHQTHEQQAPRFGRSAVEPENVFIQVVIQMGGLHCSLVGPQQPSFQQRSYPVHQRQQVITQFDRRPYYFVFVTERLQTAIAFPPIGFYKTPRLDDFSHSRLQTRLAGVSNSTQSNATDTVFGLLSRHQHQGLPLRTPPTLTLSHTTNKNLVYLDGAGQPITSRANHRAAKFLQPVPGRVITAKPQYTLETQSAGAVLLTAHVPHSFKPKSKRLVRVGKQSACG